MLFLIALLITFALFLGTSYYLAQRIYQGLVLFFPKLHFGALLTVFLVLTSIMLLGFTRSVLPFPETIKHIFSLIYAYYFGIFAYLLMFTILADFLLFLPRLLKLSFAATPYFKGYVTIAVLLLTSVTCLYGFLNARQIEHVTYEIPLQNKTDISDLNMVLISDLHLGAIGLEENLEHIVAEINALQPDIVCIAGDFFDTDYHAIRNPEAALETLRKIQSTFGIYACLGNHDAGPTMKSMLSFVEEADIHLLNEEYTIIDERLILIGRLDEAPIGDYDKLHRGELADFFTPVNPALPVVVLDHNPINVRTYDEEPVDLILCGHTHKGQLFPGSLVTNALFTVDYGYYRKDAQSPQVIVTSGVGFWGMPMRVGTNCEIVSIKFINEQSE